MEPLCISCFSTVLIERFPASKVSPVNRLFPVLNSLHIKTDHSHTNMPPFVFPLKKPKKLSQVIVSNYLVASCTPRPDLLSIVSLAVDDAIFVAVAQINEKFFTRRADKTSGMPTEILTRLRCEHRDVAGLDFTFAPMARLKNIEQE